MSDTGAYRRDETEANRLDRNYSELLQELRVAQAGVQILFGFLLTVAFQQRFGELDTFQKDLYVCTLGCSALSVVFFVAPVAAHRVVFRRGVKDHLVRFTARMAVAGLALMGLSVTGGVLLVVDLVLDRGAAWIIAGAVVVLAAVVWVAWPVKLRNRS